MKLGLNVSKLRKDIDMFFRGNVLDVLRNEGWFEYLKRPHTIMQLAAEFKYQDIEFLNYLLELLVEDGAITKIDDELYQVTGEIDFGWTCPSCFDEAMIELWVDHARAIPGRLRGEYLSFTGGLNLFNWDDALSNRLYEQIRRAAFVFADALSEPVRFLDVGCGNGRGTAAIWSYYYKNGYFTPEGQMKIFGVDPSDQLLRIANEEFPQMVQDYNGYDATVMETVEKYPVTFSKGYAEDIPFDDETFDVVYASQVLHWTNPKKAVQEMLRVLRPGGYLFGTQNFYPHANKFNEAHFKVVEGAHGFFYREDLEGWARELGASLVETATPVSVFKITK